MPQRACEAASGARSTASPQHWSVPASACGVGGGSLWERLGWQRNDLLLHHYKRRNDEAPSKQRVEEHLVGNEALKPTQV